MLHSLKAFFTSLASWLIILKYLGLSLAAGSSVWATVNVLTVDKAGGGKKLTAAGVISIVLTIVGLVISVVSEDLQRRQAAKSQAVQIAAEAKRTNDIIIAGQPLTSLSFRLQFSSKDASLWQRMKKGQGDIAENALTSQGGVTEVPLEIMEFSSALLPLLSWVAGIDGTPRTSDGKDDSVVVLMPLDESYNTILSFGNLRDGISWYGTGDKKNISHGFPLNHDARSGYSDPRGTAELVDDPSRGPSTYSISWDLDPVTLANAVDQTNPAVLATANLPQTLDITVIHSIGTLPFRQNNFALSSATNLWRKNEWARKEITPAKDFSGAVFTIEVNGFREKTYLYALRKIYDLNLLDQFDDDFETACTVFEFESTERLPTQTAQLVAERQRFEHHHSN